MDSKKDNTNNINKSSKKKCNICNKCKLEFDDYNSLEKHKWTAHPTNNYEYHWSKITDWSQYPMSYRDDPYY